MALVPIFRGSFFDFSSSDTCIIASVTKPIICVTLVVPPLRHRQTTRSRKEGETICGALTLFSHFLCFEQTILLDCSSALLEREEQKLECHFDFHTIKS